MSIRIFSLALICLLAPIGSLAEPLLANTYPIKNVRKIVVGGGAMLELQQGDTEALRAEATEDILARVTVDVTGERMTLGVKRKEGGLFSWFGDNNEKVKFIVQVKDLAQLELNGGAHAHIGDLQGASLKFYLSGGGHVEIGQLQADKVVFDLSGAARIKTGEIYAQNLEANLSGASRVEISGPGKVDNLRVDLSGASNYESKTLTSANAFARASGASHIELRVSDSLEAHASGASHINYYGKPRVQQHPSGASAISSRND